MKKNPAENIRRLYLVSKKTPVVFVFFLLLFCSEIFAQNSTEPVNRWFAEFRLANSNGWTSDIIHGADLSVGRLLLKNIYLRINGGFNSEKIDNDAFPTYYTPYFHSVYLHRYTAGADILYEINISRKMTFKTGPGYEYVYSKKELNSSEFPIPEEHENKDFANIYKLIGYFDYDFTKSIYAFIQLEVAYEKHHGSQRDNYSNGKSPITRYFEYKENNVRVGNAIIGAGISF